MWPKLEPPTWATSIFDRGRTLSATLDKRQLSQGPMFSKTLAAVTATLFASVNAHFLINVPTPISGSAIKDNLAASGSDFPCHGADLSNPMTRTAMAVGDTQPLGFDLANGANTAVHGGGSCQISITYETDPLKVRDPTNWMVIKSYIGGCPTDATANLDPGAVMCNGSNSPNCVNNLSFNIPPEVRDGNAVLAWTWFNNVGDREMYMNCAAVSFTRGQNQLDSLPTMFVANLANITQCKTTENFNTNFPNPGKYVQTESPLNFPLKGPVGSGCGPVSADVDAQTTMALGSSSSVTTLATATTLMTAYANLTAISEESQTQRASSKGNNPPGTCQNGAVPCSTPGFFCINDTTYGECAVGCAVPMQMSPGTNCVGDATSFSIAKDRGSAKRRTV
jgi:hypothetical protein